jgi:hypothetical protein
MAACATLASSSKRIPHRRGIIFEFGDNSEHAACGVITRGTWRRPAGICNNKSTGVLHNPPAVPRAYGSMHHAAAVPQDVGVVMHPPLCGPTAAYAHAAVAPQGRGDCYLTFMYIPTPALRPYGSICTGCRSTAGQEGMVIELHPPPPAPP